MKTIFKYAAAVALTGALAVAAATPGEARNGRNAAAAIGGLAPARSSARRWPTRLLRAGLLRARATPMSRATRYESDYAYEPAPVYVQPAPRLLLRRFALSQQQRILRASPASSNFGACN